MCHLKHKLRIFLFCRKIIFLFSRYSSFGIFNHPIIYQICDAMMSISTLNRAHFWIFLLNHNLLTHKHCSADARTIIFRHLLKNLGTRAKFQVLYNLLQLLNNQLCQDSSVSFFEKVKATFKNGKCQLLKMARPGYIVILIKL